MNEFLRGILRAALIIAASYQVAVAKITLPSAITDHMVLQQKSDVLIWGKTEPGRAVTAIPGWNNKVYKARADQNGHWEINMKTPSYGGPYNLKLSDGESLTLNNILIGEVWLCSGQSNMEMPLAGWGKINNYEQEIANAKYPNIRLLQVERTTSNTPLDDASIKAGWKPCTPENVAEFSSVAYFFAREIFQKTGIPVGLIHTSWGGTIAEAWTSAGSLKTMADFTKAVGEIESQATLKSQTDGPNRPTVLYNAMIHPFLKYRIKGAIWYQGESNADRAKQYQELFPLLIKDWRAKWNQGDFPFYFVQLASFMERNPNPEHTPWAELREAQSMALSLPNTGMAVAIDIGDAKDIHPKNKQDVGKRLALIALNKNYGEKNEYSGPILKDQRVKDGVVTLEFSHAEGLNTKSSGDLRGFAIAGEDKKFYWADARIEGNKVILKSADVRSPVAVRYGWGNNPDCNLYNKSGLPAPPFRTDKD